MHQRGTHPIAFSARAGKHDACSGQQAFPPFWLVWVGVGTWVRVTVVSFPQGLMHGRSFLCECYVSWVGLGSGQSRTACLTWQLPRPGGPCGVYIHVSWGVLCVHRAWMVVSVCIIGWSDPFFLSPLNGCVFQCPLARADVHGPFAGQPAPVTPFFSCASRVCGCALGRSLCFLSVQQPPRGHS